MRIRGQDCCRNMSFGVLMRLSDTVSCLCMLLSLHVHHLVVLFFHPIRLNEQTRLEEVVLICERIDNVLCRLLSSFVQSFETFRLLKIELRDIAAAFC